MVIKKEILNNLKEYNEQLDKHLPKLNMDFLNAEAILNLNSNNSLDDEFMTLMASNVVDLRTEMSLLRRNLAGDIEGMVLRQISESQKVFFDQMNKFYTNTVIDMKNNLGAYVEELSKELMNTKLELAKIASNTNLFTKTLDDFKNEMLIFKKDMEHFTQVVDEANKVNLKDGLKHELGALTEEFARKNAFLESNVLNLNKNLIAIERGIKNVDELVADNRELLRDEASQIKRIKITKNSNSASPNVRLVGDKLAQLPEGEVIKDKISHKKQPVIISNVEKLLEIERRMEKLNSLR